MGHWNAPTQIPADAHERSGDTHQSSKKDHEERVGGAIGILRKRRGNIHLEHASPVGESNPDTETEKTDEKRGSA